MGTATATDDALVALADRTGDGRPDLWRIEVEAGRLVVTVATFASGYTGLLRPIETRVPADDGPLALIGDHDRDGIDDLHVVRPGEPATLEVWLGPAFHTRTPVDVSFPTAPGSRFSLGDRHGDGVPDLFVLAADGRLTVLDGSSGFTAIEEVATGIDGPGSLHAGDVDGDGRADLVLVEGAVLTAYLGGDQSGRSDDDLIAWFSDAPGEPWSDGQPWAPGDGCPIRSGEVR
jgi:hypothetical protein